VRFSKDLLEYRSLPPVKGANANDGPRKANAQTLTLTNKGKESSEVTFFGSTLFTMDSRPRKMEPNNSENIDVVYFPLPEVPDNLVVYGFTVAIQERDHKFHAIQLCARNFTEFVVYPSPSEGCVIIDFGKVEIGSTVTDIMTKSLVLCNLYSTSYSWTIKLPIHKTKFNAFEVGLSLGELHPYDSYTVPVKLICESVGFFENVGEIEIKEASDRQAKIIKVANLILRGQVVNHSVVGLPDVLDFGSVLVFQKRSSRFTMTNNGTMRANISMLIKAPFHVEQRNVVLEAKASHVVEVLYSPTESGVTQTRLVIYMDSKLRVIQCSGTAGMIQYF
jgi:hypothetical protein